MLKYIRLFSERYDFCDFDIACSSVSTNFVKHRTSFYWIIKTQKSHECALKLTDLWNTIASLLFDLNHKFELIGASLLALAKSIY